MDMRFGKRRVRSLYKASSLMTVAKGISKYMRWAGHVGRMGQKMYAYRYWGDSHKERHHQEDKDIGGWVILEWILER
jgi:hypothetical protein